MPISARLSIVPALLLATFTFLPGCGSSAKDDVGTSDDDLSTWESATAGRPTWATADRFAGNADADEQISIQVHFKLRNEAEAEAELADISNPDSEHFGQFLSDADFASKYGPTDADVAAVHAHLQKYGLTLGTSPANRLYVTASGTVSQVQKAFATPLGKYNVEGDSRRAPVMTPRVPRSFASRISSTLGLSTSPVLRPNNVKVGGLKRSAVASLRKSGNAPADSGGTPACSEWYGATMDTTDPAWGGGYPSPAPYAACGYTPGQLRAAYGMADAVRKGNDGTGVKIAIVDAFLSPTLLQDAQTYAAQHDPDYPLQASQFSAQMAPGTPQPVDTGWYGEQTLDVEAVHTMAPGAQIVYVGAQSATDIDLVAALNMIIENKMATIISNSYGSAEGQANDFVVWQAIVTQAGLKGVGVYFASGDNGDESQNFGFATPDFPASLPGVTAVGGTSLGLGQNGQRIFETGWETGVSFLEQPAASSGDGGTSTDGGAADAGGPTWDPPAPGEFAFGGGGGTSYVYPQPAYQVGIVPDSMATIPGAPARVVPDVSMLGDPMTGFLIGETTDGVYGEGAIGGTSLACPLFAATMALVEQKAHKALGFANPRLYKKHAAAFTDVVSSGTQYAVAIPGGIITSIGFPGMAIAPAVGYDNVTGLGTPNGQAFLDTMK